MATVIKTENLSKEIILNQFRNPLRQAVGPNEADTITDPVHSERDRTNNEYMITTSRPDSPRLYPLIVVREGGDSGSRPDRRADLHEHEYDVVTEILTKSDTTYFDLRDSVRAWFENRIDTLNGNGYEDAEIVSANRTQWEAEASVVSGEIVFRGTVNTK